MTELCHGMLATSLTEYLKEILKNMYVMYALESILGGLRFYYLDRNTIRTLYYRGTKLFDYYHVDINL